MTHAESSCSRMYLYEYVELGIFYVSAASAIDVESIS